jgi:hypothetical protein
MEPITGLGIRGYFRGLREAFTYKPKISNNGSEGIPISTSMLNNLSG